MGIEPASKTAVFCHNAADRSAASWHERLAPFTALEFAISEAAGGIASGLDRVVEQRRLAGETTPLARGLDLSTAFLDRMHERLAVAEPREKWRLAMA